MSILTQFNKSIKKYDTVYVAIDIHGTIFKVSNNKKEQYNYYPFARKVLQLMSNMSNIKLILWSSTYPEKIKEYINHFESNNIHFDMINENTECVNNEYACFDKKIYVDVGFDDKYGFNPYINWFKIYIYLKLSKLIKQL